MPAIVSAAERGWYALDAKCSLTCSAQPYLLGEVAVGPIDWHNPALDQAVHFSPDTTNLYTWGTVLLYVVSFLVITFLSRQFALPSLIMCASRPSNRDDFEVSIICALPLEYSATFLNFDEFWDTNGDEYGKAPETQTAMRRVVWATTTSF